MGSSTRRPKEECGTEGEVLPWASRLQSCPRGIGGRQQLGARAAPSAARPGPRSRPHRVPAKCAREGEGLPPGPRGRGAGGGADGGRGLGAVQEVERGARAARKRARSGGRGLGSPGPASCTVCPRAPAAPASSAAASAPGRSPGSQAPRPAAQDRPAPRRPPAARAAMGVEGCTKCIKYLLFVFNFVFWVSPGRRGGGRGFLRARRPRVPLGPAEGAPPRRQVVGPPVRAGCGVGGPGPAGRGSGGRPGPPRPLTAGRGAASRVWGPVGVRARAPAAGPGRWGLQVCSRLGMVVGGLGAGPRRRPGAAQPAGGCFWDHPASRGLEVGVGSRAGLRVSRPHELIGATAPGWAAGLGAHPRSESWVPSPPLLALRSSPSGQLWSPWGSFLGSRPGASRPEARRARVAGMLVCLHMVALV